MDNLQFVIPQGSTPRLEFGLPFVLPYARSKVFVTFSQSDKNVLEYGYRGAPTPAIAGTGELTVDPNDKSLLVLNMTQADTLSLVPGDIELQLRVFTPDGADTFVPLIGRVMAAKKGGVIT